MRKKDNFFSNEIFEKARLGYSCLYLVRPITPMGAKYVPFKKLVVKDFFPISKLQNVAKCKTACSISIKKS